MVLCISCQDLNCPNIVADCPHAILALLFRLTQARLFRLIFGYSTGRTLIYLIVLVFDFSIERTDDIRIPEF